MQFIFRCVFVFPQIVPEAEAGETVVEFVWSGDVPTASEDTPPRPSVPMDLGPVVSRSSRLPPRPVSRASGGSAGYDLPEAEVLQEGERRPRSRGSDSARSQVQDRPRSRGSWGEAAAAPPVQGGLIVIRRESREPPPDRPVSRASRTSKASSRVFPSDSAADEELEDVYTL